MGKKTRQTDAEKNATALGRWITQGLVLVRTYPLLAFFLGISGSGFVSGGFGSFVSSKKVPVDMLAHFDSAVVQLRDSVSELMQGQLRIESKVDKCLVAQRVMGGVILKLPEGPAALKQFRKESREKRESADPWNLSAEPTESKPLARVKPRAEKETR